VSFYPLEHETLELALSGNLMRVPTDKFLSFEAGVPLEIFVFILAVAAGFPDDLTRQYGQRLLAGTAKAIRRLGERGIEMAGIYATSRYPAGIRLCRKLGMVEKPI